MRAECVLFLGAFFLSGLDRTNADDASNRNDLFRQAHSAAEQKGVIFTAEYTGEVFGNLSGGIKTGATYESLLRVSLQLDLAQLVCWNGATIYGSMLYPPGKGLTDQYTVHFTRLTNIDPSNRFRLFKLLFYHNFFG